MRHKVSSVLVIADTRNSLHDIFAKSTGRPTRTRTTTTTTTMTSLEVLLHMQTFLYDLSALFWLGQEGILHSCMVYGSRFRYGMNRYTPLSLIANWIQLLLSASFPLRSEPSHADIDAPELSSSCKLRSIEKRDFRLRKLDRLMRRPHCLSP